jgi:(p)ppGpp synthase/HD superfamily hydrolase
MRKTKLGRRFEQALKLAMQLHRKQKRKISRTPYFSHLMEVAALVLQDGGSEDQAITALLHDAAEDQGGRAILQQIKRQFGNDVAEMVEACSDSLDLVKSPWQERKERHLAHLQNAPQGAYRVLLADKICNGRSLLRNLRQDGPRVWGYFNGGKEGTLWYYRAMYQLLSAKQPGVLADELRWVIEEIEAFAQQQEE